ncbi:MAG: TIGR02391 family protein [Acidimicrobiia bacterium]
MSVELGQSGRDEQEGFRFIFMGVIQGIRNPKGHELVEQGDPQRALEYLALVSVLFRRLDDARGEHT